MDHKYVAPTKQVSAPYGTIWTYMNEKNEKTIYIQLSKNEQEPCWKELAELLKQIWEPYFESETFIKETVKISEETFKDTEEYGNKISTYMIAALKK